LPQSLFLSSWPPTTSTTNMATSTSSDKKDITFGYIATYTRHTRGLACCGSATSATSSSSTTSGQALRDYIDCIRHMICFHVGSTAADKKS
jgi:hypothetical protein